MVASIGFTAHCSTSSSLQPISPGILMKKELTPEQKQKILKTTEPDTNITFDKNNTSKKYYKNLTEGQIIAWRGKHILNEIPPNMIQYIPVKCIVALKEGITEFTPDQIQQLTSVQLRSISTSAFTKFTKAQIQAIDSKKIPQAFTDVQLMGFTNTTYAKDRAQDDGNRVISLFSLEQLKQFTKEQKNYIERGNIKEVLNNLSDKQKEDYDSNTVYDIQSDAEDASN
jgi:hypothetical protein